MYNWSVDEEAIKKADPEGYDAWRIQTLINYGLPNGEKLNERLTRKHWAEIKDDIIPSRRRYIELLLNLSPYAQAD